MLEVGLDFNISAFLIKGGLLSLSGWQMVFGSLLKQKRVYEAFSVEFYQEKQMPGVPCLCGNWVSRWVLRGRERKREREGEEQGADKERWG